MGFYAEPEGQKEKVVLLSEQQPSGILTTSGSGKGLQPERAAARRDDVTSDGTKKGVGAPSRWLEGGAQTQVPWCAGGRALRFFKACDLSLKSVGFCWEMSISALATMIPGKTGGKEFVSTSYLNAKKKYFTVV